MSSAAKNISADKIIPEVIEKIIKNARNNSNIAFRKKLFIIFIIEFTIGTPGIKNNEQAIVGFKESGLKKYAQVVAMNAAKLIAKNSLTLCLSNFICVNFPAIAANAVQIISVKFPPNKQQNPPHAIPTAKIICQ